jgi:hypothetical protein
MFAHLVDRNDVGVFQLRGRLGLELEPRAFGGAGKLAGQNEFQSNEALETDVAGLVNHPHATASDLAEEFVIAKLLRLRALHGGPIRQAKTQQARDADAAGRIGGQFCPTRGTLANGSHGQSVLINHIKRKWVEVLQIFTV